MVLDHRSDVGPMTRVPRCLSERLSPAEAAAEAGVQSPRPSWTQADRAMTSLPLQTRLEHLPTRNRQIAPAAPLHQGAPQPRGERQERAELRRDAVDAAGR